MSDWQRYALIDCAQADGLHASLIAQAQAAQTDAASLFDGQPEAPHAASAPWLVAVPLDQRTRELTAWINHRQHDSVAVSWLAAECDFDKLHAHLQSCLDAQLPDGSIGLLRYWDTRVFLRLQRVLRPNQQIALMGPVLEWEVRLHGEVFHLSRSNLLEHIRHMEIDEEGKDADVDA